MNKKISCLTATYGRLSKLNEAVSCFFHQDYNERELIILNNHPIPLKCNIEKVFVYNEPIYPTQGDCRNRLLELATGDFIRTWDDDDLYMPWTLSQGIENIKDSPAWKPTKSWFWAQDKEPELVSNSMEASIIVKTDIAKRYGYKPNSAGDEHETLLNGIFKEGGLSMKDMGLNSSYVYRWGFGMWHISGTLGQPDVQKRISDWYDKNNDTQDGIIRLVDIDNYWDNFPNWDRSNKKFIQ